MMDEIGTEAGGAVAEHRGWPEDFDKRDQVRAVADTLTEPRTAGWVAEEADVSEATARKHLNALVEEQVVATRTGPGGAKLYYPDPKTAVFEQVRRLSDLRQAERDAELERIASEIETWQAAFDVDGPDELRMTIDESLDPDEREYRREAAYDWKHDLATRELIKLAIDLSGRIDALVDDRAGKDDGIEALDR